MALLLISHDLNIVRKMADEIHVMRAGKFVESGKREAVFHSPRHDYTRMLLSAEPSGRSGKPSDDARVVMETESMRVLVSDTQRRISKGGGSCQSGRGR